MAGSPFPFSDLHLLAADPLSTRTVIETAYRLLAFRCRRAHEALPNQGGQYVPGHASASFAHGSGPTAPDGAHLRVNPGESLLGPQEPLALCATLQQCAA